jgi:hypothetical protein
MESILFIHRKAQYWREINFIQIICRFNSIQIKISANIFFVEIEICNKKWKDFRMAKTIHKEE